jgi:hypothetical protein
MERSTQRGTPMAAWIALIALIVKAYWRDGRRADR